ncbi:DUF2147 domain-containing protein [Oceanicola sp. 502str15]|uniref:DUF2147 domain-containing protein n=1 Tax=Oceanicola sp. 502str15 TaxID=2696061 RepID=UPI002096611B|nr:DUF2147 domain-containing protein [Oceanicola sp. 502str15]
MTKFRTMIFTAAAMALTSVAAHAGTPEGLWLTGPDKKGNVAHVQAVKCGAAVCGTIVKAFNSAGQPIQSPNVGKRVFWDMTPAGADTYQGRAYVPVMNRDYGAQMVLRGNKMLVKGCAGPICMDQTWTRLK